MMPARACLFALVLAMALACDDEDDDASDAAACVEECVADGYYACEGGKRQLRSCGAGNTCLRMPGPAQWVPSCLRSPMTTCNRPGENFVPRCEGALLVTCRSYAHTTMYEHAEDCAATGGTCTATASGARCDRPDAGGQ